MTRRTQICFYDSTHAESVGTDVLGGYPRRLRPRIGDGRPPTCRLSARAEHQSVRKWVTDTAPYPDTFISIACIYIYYGDKNRP